MNEHRLYDYENTTISWSSLTRTFLTKYIIFLVLGVIEVYDVDSVYRSSAPSDAIANPMIVKVIYPPIRH